jgi:GR25 family glycosyltransferase involved in LPS biosynthesis
MSVTAKLGAWFDPVRVAEHAVRWRLRRCFGRRLALWRCRPLLNEQIRTAPIFCISLPDATDRRAYVQAQARRLGLTGLRFLDAVDGRGDRADEFSHAGAYDDAVAMATEGRHLSASEIAVALSHRSAWEQISVAPQPYALVLEDDAILNASRLDSLDTTSLPDGWDACILEAWLRGKPPAGHIAGNAYDLSSYKGGAGGYLLSRAGARKLVAVSLPVSHPADGLFVWFNRQRDVRLGKGFSPATPALRAVLWWPFPVLNGSGTGHWASSIGTSVIPY